MNTAKQFLVGKGWRLILADLGIRPADVLRGAGLPEDLFNKERVTLPTEAYFRLWQSLETLAGDPCLPLNIGAALSVEAFDPPIFAAMCSPNLNRALERLSFYKPLIGPMKLTIEVRDRETQLVISMLDSTKQFPAVYAATELVFFVQLARLGTRAPIKPMEVMSVNPMVPHDAYRRFFDCPVVVGDRLQLRFSARDAGLPFLTSSDLMWSFFEPELRRRLSELDEAASFSDRVNAVLLEVLPGGNASADEVASRLGTSVRTLQRRLRKEGESFQALLKARRTKLAEHYLVHSKLSGAEISFLLGFDDPNSFFRAFHQWTGQTPERLRAQFSTHE